MTTIPKPKYCGQNWLEMNPTDGGRICGQCDKKIVDFSKTSWSEIEKLQRQNNNGVCGMYNPRQLDNWGQEIPTYNNSLLKAAAITGLTISFATSSHGQTINTADSIVIKGKIIDETTSEELPFVNVLLKNSKVGTATDIDGNFKLVLRNVLSTPMPDTLEVNYVGYRKKQIIFRDIKEINNSENKIKLEDGKLNLTLAPATENIIAFYVRKPTLGQRIKWKFKKWFGRKEK
jgi:CarboxypepD_reg-like domain